MSDPPAPVRRLTEASLRGMTIAAAEASVRFANAAGMPVKHPTDYGLSLVDSSYEDAQGVWEGRFAPKDLYDRTCARATAQGLHRGAHPAWSDHTPATRGFFQVFAATVLEVGEALDRSGVLYEPAP